HPNNVIKQSSNALDANSSMSVSTGPFLPLWNDWDLAPFSKGDLHFPTSVLQPKGKDMMTMSRHRQLESSTSYYAGSTPDKQNCIKPIRDSHP
ncbi:hypothetical protein Ancab_019478, partial [Ancistrocladus abbreviatus]